MASEGLSSLVWFKKDQVYYTPKEEEDSEGKELEHILSKERLSSLQKVIKRLHWTMGIAILKCH